jgi:hypothetical protein
MVFNEPFANIPVKCIVCRTNIPASVIERQLDPDRLMTLITILAATDLASDERLQSCPCCPYFEVWLKDKAGMDFLFCRREGCKKVTCVHCLRQCDPPEADAQGNSFTSSPDGEYPATRMEFHFTCAELAPLKVRFERALQEGLTMRCPSCGLEGQKDDSCTHMVSPRLCDYEEQRMAPGSSELGGRRPARPVVRAGRCGAIAAERPTASSTRPTPAARSTVTTWTGLTTPAAAP